MTDAFALRDNPKAQAALDAFAGGRFPHAILIEGPPGSGKSRFARRVAMAALCRAPQNAPCGACSACKKVVGGIHPDLLVFAGEKGKAKSFHVDQVRALRAQAYVSPNEGERKVLLLEDAHTMTEQAQNALLKVLEEPPASAVFVLTCQNRSQLLETILSRVTLITLHRPGIEACADILAEHLPDTPRDILLQAAWDAMGSVGVALESLAREGEEGDAGHGDCACRVLHLLEQGREAAALAALVCYERDRPGFLAMLEALSAQVTGRLISPRPDAGLTQLQLVRIAAIIEETAHAAYSNVGGLLLGSALCAKISGALE